MNLLKILAQADFNWCPSDDEGLIPVFRIVKVCLNVIRIAIPIILIVMTVLDVSKNVINPDEKDSMKKIGNRIIAAVVVFLVPTIVNIIIKIADVALGNDTASNATNDRGLLDCWNAAK